MAVAVALLALWLGLGAQASKHPLLDAVQRGHLGEVQELLRDGADVDATDDDFGRTPLMWAAKKNHTEMVKAILAKNPEVDLQTKGGWSALMEAARFGSTEMVKAILAKNPQVDLQTKAGSSALMLAAQYGSTEMVKAILAENPKVDLQTKAGSSALMLAAQYGSTEMVKAILAKNPKVDLQNKYGWSALMDAARYGSTEMVKAILAKNPQVDMESNSGGTALLIAAQRGFTPKVLELLAANASLEHRDLAGRTALFRAAEWGQFDTVALLLDHGARPEVVARNGQTALQAAMHATKSRTAIIKILQKDTPMGWALLQKREESPRLWKLMGMAITAGVFSGLLWYCTFSQSLVSSQGSPGARRVALKAITKQSLLHKCFRAMEVSANIYLPLGVGLLWLNCKILLPLYMTMYILPRACEVGKRGMQHPLLLLVGLKRGKGLCDSRGPRIIMTAVFLALAYLMPLECDKEIDRYIHGNAALECKGPLAALMVGTSFMPPVLSPAGATFLCPPQNHMTYQMKWTYFAFVGGICLISAAWLLMTVAEMLGVITPAVALSAEDEQCARQLEAMLIKTNTAEEVNEASHGCVTAKAEKDCVWIMPGGIYFSIFMAILDGVVLDLVTITNLIKAGQFYFAAATAFIVTTSSIVELSAVHLNVAGLLAETQESVKKGIITGPLMKLLELEQAFEAPFSFALNCYSWNFAAVADLSGFALLSGMGTLLLGIYTLAEAAYFFEDLDLYCTKPQPEMYRLLTVEAKA